MNYELVLYGRDAIYNALHSFTDHEFALEAANNIATAIQIESSQSKIFDKIREMLIHRKMEGALVNVIAWFSAIAWLSAVSKKYRMYR